VLWTRDILVRFRMRSGSSGPYLCLMDSYADPGGPLTYGSGTLVKSHKTVEIKVLLLYLLDDE
jgi:hypothetical protein